MLMTKADRSAAMALAAADGAIGVLLDELHEAVLRGAIGSPLGPEVQPLLLDALDLADRLDREDAPAGDREGATLLRDVASKLAAAMKARRFEVLRPKAAPTPPTPRQPTEAERHQALLERFEEMASHQGPPPPSVADVRARDEDAQRRLDAIAEQARQIEEHEIAVIRAREAAAMAESEPSWLERRRRR
jgi:hypothetical protein